MQSFSTTEATSQDYQALPCKVSSSLTGWNRYYYQPGTVLQCFHLGFILTLEGDSEMSEFSLSLSNSLVSRTLVCKLQLFWSTQTLSFISSTQSVQQELPGFPSIQSSNTLSNWTVTGLISFFFSQDGCFSLSNILEKSLVHIFVFVFWRGYFGWENESSSFYSLLDGNGSLKNEF